MAKEYQQDVLEESSENQEPADTKVFADEVQEELSERDIFAGDEDFYKRLATRDRTQIPNTQSWQAESGPSLNQKVPIQNKYSILQKTLVISIIMILVVHSIEISFVNACH